MREIKFRAWDKEKKEMIVPYEIVWTKSGISCRDIKPGTRKNCEFMQFTELHDKNGKEIYEGDVVKVLFDGRIYVAEWDNVRGWWAAKSKNFSKRMAEASRKGEIVGNIYENPELLLSPWE